MTTDRTGRIAVAAKSLQFLRGTILNPPTQEEYAAATSVQHFFGIDMLRAFAALIILVWHYKHFYYTPEMEFVDGIAVFDQSVQPFYNLLLPFYHHGFWAVGFFWVISGFVFAHIYAGRKTQVAAFVAARFARLYPLHLITLITVAWLQSTSWKLLGHYTLVGENSPTGFVLHLFFMSAWGFEHGNNFNGPIWSVSVEIAIYAVFFLLARRVFSFGLLTSIFVVASMFLLINDQSPVNNFHLCAFFFFTGTALYLWVIRFRENSFMLFFPSVVSGLSFFYFVASGKYTSMRFYDVQCLLFPPIILLVAWLDFQPKARNFLSKFKWFGDTTYSSYLWHFPIQILIVMLLSYFGVSSEIFNQAYIFIAWIVGVTLISRVSFLCIEKPLQRLCLSAYKRGWAIELRP